MAGEALKLSVYLGERDRAGRRLLCDALMEVFERREARAAVLFRGIEGFGIKHRLLSERTLTLSEDLPVLISVLDTPPRIAGMLEDVRRLSPHGLITLERARLLDGAQDAEGASRQGGAVKLTIQLGRHERAGRVPAHIALVDCLHRHGLEGATVQLGLDGVLHGARRRARFFAGNLDVPLTLTSVGDPRALAGALAELAAMLEHPTMTLERVQVCKRDGVLLAAPAEAPMDRDGRSWWQKLVVYSGERSRHAGAPLYSALVRRLRVEGAAGATALRGVWGYHGAHPPHGERFWSLARHVPVVTVLLDTPANMRRWFQIVDELTDETGLVTSELVPALRAGAPDLSHGGLELAAPAPER
jgi:PII-like signaling protein